MSSSEIDRDATNSDPILRIALARSPFWTRGSAGGVVVVTVLLGMMLAAGPGEGVALVALAGWAAVVAYIILWRSLSRPRRPAALELWPDRLVLPRRAGSGRVLAIPYDAIRSFDIWFPAPREALVLDTNQGLFVYPLRQMEAPETADLACREIRDRIAALPSGRAQLEQIEAREALGRAAAGRVPYATWTLLALLVVAFIAELASGALDSPAGLGLVRLGANAPVLVRQGELFRLIAANFLHGNFLHIYLNASALAVLGVLLERLMGPWRLLLIYEASALAGSAASTLLQPGPMSVGASTAIFGLLGAFLVVHLWHRSDLPAGFRQRTRWWVVILGLNALLPVLIPIIDWVAHLGGFLAGALVALPLTRSKRAIDSRERTAEPIRISAIVMSVVFAAGIAAAARYAAHTGPAAAAPVVESMARKRGVSPERLNELAWEIAIDPEAPRAMLEVALEAARRAVALDPDEPALIDTLAQAHYRLRHYDEAVRLESDALEKEQRPFFATQLGRFLSERKRAQGPIARGELAPQAIRPWFQEGARGLDLVVDVGFAPARAQRVYAIMKDGTGQHVGLLDLCVGGTARVPVRGKRSQTAWSVATSFDVVYVLGGGCRLSAPEPVELHLYPADPEAIRLP